MAFSPLQPKALHHNCSLSLPCKSHISTSHFNENLSTYEATCSSFSSLNNRLNNLKNLYSKTNDLFMLPHIQQIIRQECDKKWVDQVLDGYISLLDACTTAKDLVSSTKQHVQELLSSLRRKDLDNGIRCYLSSRRKSKKIIQKSLKNLRSFRSIASSEKDCETMDVVCTFKETELAAVTVFESLLSYLNGATVQAKGISGWSLVSKVMQSKKFVCEDVNEFDKIDGFLQRSLEDVQVEEITTQLKGVDSSIQSLEEELKCLFRQLIRSRVFLLNILNH